MRETGCSNRRHAALAVAASVALSVLSSGCGYSLAGRGSFLPAYIKTIGLPLFTNNTPLFDIERRLTDKVRSELIGRGRFSVTPDRTGVDALLTGEVLAINSAPVAFNQQQQATRLAITLVAKIEFRDLKTNKVVWSNAAWQFSEQYDVTSTASADANAFLGGNINAQERLATEFARSVVSAILEAF